MHCTNLKGYGLALQCSLSCCKISVATYIGRVHAAQLLGGTKSCLTVRMFTCLKQALAGLCSKSTDKAPLSSPKRHTPQPSRAVSCAMILLSLL